MNSNVKAGSEICCPSEDELRQFLGGSPHDLDESILAIHLEACPKCLEACRQITKKDSDRPSIVKARQKLAGLSAKRPTSTNDGNRSELSGSEVSQGVVAYSGLQVGRFVLQKQLGAGGMGQVWLAKAVDHSGQLAAVKFVPEARSDPERWARFRFEQKCLAEMDHPHFARMIEAGYTSNGYPYLAMEYVDGMPIVAWCRAHGLVLSQRLRLFLEVCNAIQYAHQRGVIHRDLKPANILVRKVNNQPTVRVIDFGLARTASIEVDDSDPLTTSHQIVGTLAYMSPEQAIGEPAVDIRTDVYSLGIVLYELLTDSTPISHEDTQHDVVVRVLDRIRLDVPEKPSARIVRLHSKVSSGEKLAKRHGKVVELSTNSIDSYRRLLQGDLDWICLKALEKEPVRRYETVAAFGSDIERYLNGRPVEARPPSATYLLSRFVRRNRLAVTLASMLLVALTMGILGTSYGLIRANRALWAESQKSGEVASLLGEVTKERDHARELREQTLSVLDDISSQISPDRPGVTSNPDSTQTLAIQRVLLSHYETIKKDVGSDEKTRSRVADAHFRAGRLQWLLGNLTEAKRDLEQANVVYDELVKIGAIDEQLLLKAIGTRMVLHGVYASGGDFEAALRVDQEVEVAIERESLWRQKPKFLDLMIANTANKAISLAFLGRDAEAAEEYQHGIDLLPAATQVNYKVYGKNYFSILFNYAIFVADRGNREKALQLLNQCKEVVVASDPLDELTRNTRLVMVHVTLAQLVPNESKEDEYRQAIDLAEKNAKQHPQMEGAQLSLADTRWSYGRFLLGNADTAKRGEDLLNEAVNLAESQATLHPESTLPLRVQANALSALGRHLDFSRRSKESIPVLTKAVEIQESLVKRFPDNSNFGLELSIIVSNLAHAYGEIESFQQSVDFYSKSISISEAMLKKQPTLTPAIQNIRSSHWGRAYSREGLGDIPGALNDWEMALKYDGPASYSNCKQECMNFMRKHGQTRRALSLAEAITGAKEWGLIESIAIATVLVESCKLVPERKLELEAKAIAQLKHGLTVRNEPELIRNDPVFQEILKLPELQEVLVPRR